MDIEQALLDIVGHTYETAQDDEHWKLVTEGICRLLNASGARLLLVDKTHRYIPIVLGGQNTGDYSDYLARTEEDPWRKAALNSKSPVGFVDFGRNFVSEKELLNTDFYYDILKPADYFHAMGGLLDDTNDYNVAISLNRSRSFDDFSERDRTLINKLAPHLKRAILLRHQFQTSQQQNTMLENSLDALSSAITIVDAGGRICYFNQAMSELLDAQNDLQIKQQHLWFKSSQLTQQLNTLIGETVAMFNGKQDDARSSLAVQINQQPYLLLALPLGSSAFYDLAKTSGCVALSFTQQTGTQSVSKTILANLYHLTVREIQLCDALMADLSLQEAAEKVGITPSTARSYLKNIFQKMDVQSQSSLILRLSKLSGLR